MVRQMNEDLKIEKRRCKGVIDTFSHNGNKLYIQLLRFPKVESKINASCFVKTLPDLNI